MKIICRTLFDCTYTGVTGHFRVAQIPFADRSGKQIASEAEWYHARNQQRNWETLMQVISLRAQPLNPTVPECRDDLWEFEFGADNPGVFSVLDNPDPIAGLRQDFSGVPMLTGLDEADGIENQIIVDGPGQNIWLEAINNEL